ncbi:hypothetical protein HGRIS_004017 [Hohenbuehelia grisea]|uniref:Origin recognition complex subunit 1 n=1 Tax=Hohenbuehelia grisea TaxID=104357 RepID=A0ABR3JHP9_9AGAR
MAVPQTPTRRSKRFQPLVSPSKPKTGTNTQTKCPNEPLLVRPTQAHSDLLDEELEEWQQDEDAQDGFHTSFYDTFTRSQASSRGKKPPGKRARKTKETNMERYAIGDTVFVSTIGRQLSIGVITSIFTTLKDDQEDENVTVKVRVHWFLRHNELPQIGVKREHFKNEIYYTLSRSAVFTTDSIVSHCTVTDTPPPPVPKKTARWTIVSHDTDDEDGHDRAAVSFYCRFAVNSQRGIFYEFAWSQHLSLCKGSDANDLTAWDVMAAESSKEGRKPKAAQRPRTKTTRNQEDAESAEESGDDSDGYEHAEDEDDADSENHMSEVEEEIQCDPSDEEDELDEPKTPSRKRKRVAATPRKTRVPSSPSKRGRSAPSTPRKSRTSNARLAQPTPHSKAALAQRRKKQKMNIRPSGLSYEGLADVDHLPQDPWQRALHLLHVGSRPDALPCRDDEYGQILHSVNDLLEEGSGGCIYISGVPGTGKTATVHAVIRELKRLAEDNETNPFNYVEINGLRISEPAAAYSLLWEAVSGHDAQKDGHMKISSKESLKLLTKHFSTANARGPGGHACVVLMDELDQLMTTKQDVVYNFFNWPTLVGSKLVVLAVANTMDLPERVMTGRVRSRLGRQVALPDVIIS